jgi:hypothetical protein
VDLLPSSQTLKLGEENEVSLEIHAPGLSKLEIRQVQYFPGATGKFRTPHFPEGGWAILPVLHHSDGSAYVRVIPRVLGQVVLRITARFPDGGETNTEATITVGPPDNPPDKVIVGLFGAEDRSIPMRELYLKPYPGTFVPAIQAVYGGERFEINPAFVSFEIRSANDASIIKMDKSTGLIAPLQKGEALLETTFQGWSILTCILVEDEWTPGESTRPRCESLLLPGERLATPIRNGNPQ